MASKDTLEALRAQMNSILERPSCKSDAKATSWANASKDMSSFAGSTDALTREPTVEDSSEKAFKKIVALLNASEKSERMLRERLAKLDFTQQSIDTAIDRAKSYGYIDDRRYGEVLVRSRLSQGKGCAGIERELLEQGIDPYSLPGFPEEFGIDDETEFDRAFSLLVRKPPRAKNARDAAYRKLMQKGYSSSVASSAARTWYESQREGA